MAKTSSTENTTLSPVTGLKSTAQDTFKVVTVGTLASPPSVATEKETMSW